MLRLDSAFANIPAYLIAQKPTLATATATSTALVTDVLPVIHGSRNAAVKQKRERCRIYPNAIPNPQ